MGRTVYSRWRDQHFDPWDIDTRCKERWLPPDVPPLAPPPNVIRIDAGREPARPSLSTIRARKRAT